MLSLHTLPKTKNIDTIVHRTANRITCNPGVPCHLIWGSVRKSVSFAFADNLAISTDATSFLRNHVCCKSLTLVSMMFKKGNCRKLGGRYVVGGSA
jgi:hypothetical protein